MFEVVSGWFFFLMLRYELLFFFILRVNVCYYCINFVGDKVCWFYYNVGERVFLVKFVDDNDDDD